jgi:hypothetical protein
MWDVCREAGIDPVHFSQYLPRRAGRKPPHPESAHADRPHRRAGEAPKKVPDAAWSKVRRKILAVAKILGVPASRVFVEDGGR